jgi:flagellar biosynthesis anti-sigma factor FlgM
MVGVNPANITRLRLMGEADTSRAATSAPGTGPSQAGPSAAAPAQAGGDNLRLSDQARALSEGMMKGPPVDRALVERLGSAIAEGRYPVDPDRIAAAMCADCFDLPS